MTYFIKYQFLNNSSIHKLIFRLVLTSLKLPFLPVTTSTLHFQINWKQKFNMNLEINLLVPTRKYHLITKKLRKTILDLGVGWIQNQLLNQLIQMFPSIKIWVQEICPFLQSMVPKPLQMKQVWNHTYSVANFNH